MSSKAQFHHLYNGHNNLAITPQSKRCVWKGLTNCKTPYKNLTDFPCEVL